MNNLSLEKSLHWLAWVLRPRQSAYSLLQQRAHERQFYKQMLTIWTTTALIDVTLSFPVGNLFGVPWNNVGFYGTYLICFLVVLAAGALITHWTLLLSNLKSISTETFAIYTVSVVYSPFVYLFSLPNVYNAYSVVSSVKHEHRDIVGGANRMVAIISSQPHDALYYIIEIAEHGSLFVACVAWALVAELLIAWYGNGRFATYRVLVRAQLIMVFPLFVFIAPVELFALYSYLS
jgi:hypothetical protein